MAAADEVARLGLAAKECGIARVGLSDKLGNPHRFRDNTSNYNSLTSLHLHWRYQTGYFRAVTKPSDSVCVCGAGMPTVVATMFFFSFSQGLR